MTQFTRQAIKASFLKLLNERPITQITVKDIAADCKINRNTFYYHFQDIPNLMENIVMEAAEELIAQYPSCGSLEVFLSRIVDYVMDYRQALLHIYHSANRELFEQYLWKVCQEIARLYLDSLTLTENLPKEDEKALCQYLKCLCFGIISGWFYNGLKDDIRIAFRHVYGLRRIQAEEWTGYLNKSDI